MGYPVFPEPSDERETVLAPEEQPWIYTVFPGGTAVRYRSITREGTILILNDVEEIDGETWKPTGNCADQAVTTIPLGFLFTVLNQAQWEQHVEYAKGLHNKRQAESEQQEMSYRMNQVGQRAAMEAFMSKVLPPDMDIKGFLDGLFGPE